MLALPPSRSFTWAFHHTCTSFRFLLPLTTSLLVATGAAAAAACPGWCQHATQKIQAKIEYT